VWAPRSLTDSAPRRVCFRQIGGKRNGGREMSRWRHDRRVDVSSSLLVPSLSLDTMPSRAGPVFAPTFDAVVHRKRLATTLPEGHLEKGIIQPSSHHRVDGSQVRSNDAARTGATSRPTSYQWQLILTRHREAPSAEAIQEPERKAGLLRLRLAMTNSSDMGHYPMPLVSYQRHLTLTRHARALSRASTS
jgi:hypothetical protein